MNRSRAFVLACAVLVCYPPVLPSATAAEVWRTQSTSYCLRGGTVGGVAVALADFAALRGTRWTVIQGPRVILGRTFIVADKGPRAHFDWWQSSCRAAGAYGGHLITVQRSNRSIDPRVRSTSIVNPPTDARPMIGDAVCYSIPEVPAC